MKILSIIEKSKQFWFLLVVLFSFFLLRLPSLFEPYWYGDEGIYQVLGMGMNQGRILYRDIWDNKPPLLYMLYALFSSDQFTLRAVSLVFGLLSIIVFFFLAKKLFYSQSGGNKIAFFTTSIYSVLFGLPLLEGNIANSENFMLFPILLSGFLIVKLYSPRVIPAKAGIQNKNDMDSHFHGNDKKKYLILFLAGLVLSFAFLFKIVAIFDFAAFILFIFFIEFENIKNLFSSIINVASYILGFIIAIVLTALYFVLNNAFFDFIKAAFMQNVGYVGYGNKFIIPQGLLIAKLFVLSLFILFIFSKRKILKPSTIFVLIWLAFSIFNALFSQRPYTHYLLVLLPSFCLFLGLLIWDKRMQKIYLFSLFVLIVILANNFTIYAKTSGYYQNFISFITGSKNVFSYQNFFDRNTPNDYELAQFIRTHTSSNDSIFIWGNNAQVYKLANKLPVGRFTVAYHMSANETYLKETLNAINKSNPKYIIVTSPKNPIPYSVMNYSRIININNSTIYERAF